MSLRLAFDSADVFFQERGADASVYTKSQPTVANDVDEHDLSTWTL